MSFRIGRYFDDGGKLLGPWKERNCVPLCVLKNANLIVWLLELLSPETRSRLRFLEQLRSQQRGRERPIVIHGNPALLSPRAESSSQVSI